MSFYLLLPEDLKRELGKWLHRLYFAVVLDELKLMTVSIHKECYRPAWWEGGNGMVTSFTESNYRNSPINSVFIELYRPRWGICVHDSYPGIDNISEYKRRNAGKMATLP
jgi:hypothetical protein